MAREKSIIIGCDDTATLSAVLSDMKQTDLFLHHTITAARTSDLISVMRSLEPDLVILGFRNNQLVLNDIDTFVKKPQVPILCLMDKQENDLLRWNPHNMVFTCPLTCLQQTNRLCARLHSIFMLREGNVSRLPTSATFADAALQGDIPGERNLSRYILELDQKVDVLLKVKERITSLYPIAGDPVRTELVSIVNSIKSSANDHKLWEDFKLYFEKTNPDFLFLLSQKHPELTTRDLKYCCYVKMNMTNDDIKNLLGINQESVRTHKYRLKKKMSLSRNQDLRTYIRSVGKEHPLFA